MSCVLEVCECTSDSVFLHRSNLFEREPERISGRLINECGQTKGRGEVHYTMNIVSGTFNLSSSSVSIAMINKTNKIKKLKHVCADERLLGSQTSDSGTYLTYSKTARTAGTLSLVNNVRLTQSGKQLRKPTDNDPAAELCAGHKNE